MRVLIIKTSSLGDVVHTLPAVTDATLCKSGIRFDWVVEEAFAEVPVWHAAVDEVIPVALRRWKHRPFHVLRAGEPQAAVRYLRSRHYDHIIDAQGLIKSALIARLARGPRSGLDRDSAREPLAARAYDHTFAIARNQHAVQRVRQLFAAALDYPVPDESPDYGIKQHFPPHARQPYLVFLHGTTWPTKHWPDDYWRRLASMAAAAGLPVKIPWGNAIEQQRAQQIAAVANVIEVLPRMQLGELAAVIAAAGAVVGVDTGLVHLAAALGTPCITLYGSTDPGLIGTLGESQIRLEAQFPCAPCQQRKCRYPDEAEVFPACYSTLDPDRVWSELQKIREALID
ncbi:MAG: lipopolysaccharide heptosyltransferase I [Pseudomonadota bacterium]